MQRYDTYKSSGVKWLGEIPSHWESIPLKKCFISSESGLWGDDPKQNDDDAICIRVADFDYSKFSIKTEHLTLRSYGNLLSENKKLTKGDLLLEKSGGGELFPVGRVVRFNLDLGKTTCSNFIQKLSPSQNYCSSFLCYLFSSMYTKKVNGLFYNQTTGIKNLKIKEYLNQTVFLPPLAEQTAIANYLDAATAKIDAATAQQQKMIDLLNERKQIIINRAVTKGLNPNAKMKDSGVEWIGEVPEGWEVRKLKHIAKLQSGDTISSDNFTEAGYPVFGGNGFRGYTNRYTNDGDYVLIGRQGALCGNVNYAHGQFFASEHAVVVYPYNKENLVWLGEVIRASNLNQYSQSAAQPGLAVSLIQNIYYPYPPKEEREVIAACIEKNINKINGAIDIVNRQISLLQERKQIIINEVVTGKVKAG